MGIKGERSQEMDLMTQDIQGEEKRAGKEIMKVKKETMIEGIIKGIEGGKRKKIIEELIGEGNQAENIMINIVINIVINMITKIVINTVKDIVTNIVIFMVTDIIIKREMMKTKIENKIVN